MYRYDEEITGAEPVTAAELASTVFVTDPAQNLKLEALITTARQQIESHCRIAVVKRTTTLFMDRWPTAPRSGRDQWWNGVKEMPISELYEVCRSITLPMPPLQSVTSITTYDDADAGTVFGASGYFVDNASKKQQGRIVLRTGGVWPVAYRVANAIKVIYVCGYDNGAVPVELKRAILGVAAWLWANPGDCDKNCTEMCGAAALVKSFVIHFPK